MEGFCPFAVVRNSSGSLSAIHCWFVSSSSLGVGGTLVEVHIVLLVLTGRFGDSDDASTIGSDEDLASLSEERASCSFVDGVQEEEEEDVCELHCLIAWKTDASFGWRENESLGQQSPTNELGVEW